jgi:hypothetical protein
MPVTQQSSQITEGFHFTPGLDPKLNKTLWPKDTAVTWLLRVKPADNIPRDEATFPASAYIHKAVIPLNRSVSRSQISVFV